MTNNNSCFFKSVWLNIVSTCTNKLGVEMNQMKLDIDEVVAKSTLHPILGIPDAYENRSISSKYLISVFSPDAQHTDIVQEIFFAGDDVEFLYIGQKLNEFDHSCFQFALDYLHTCPLDDDGYSILDTSDLLRYVDRQPGRGGSYPISVMAAVRQSLERIAYATIHFPITGFVGHLIDGVKNANGDESSVQVDKIKLRINPDIRKIHARGDIRYYSVPIRNDLTTELAKWLYLYILRLPEDRPTTLQRIKERSRKNTRMPLFREQLIDAMDQLVARKVIKSWSFCRDQRGLECIDHKKVEREKKLSLPFM